MRAFFWPLALVLLLSCDWDYVPRNQFAHDLVGTWESHDENEPYIGSLEIDYSWIIIDGYGGNQTPEHGIDARRPFRNFTKGVALEAYSEMQNTTGNSRSGAIFINDRGSWQGAINFTYWTTRDPFTYGNIEFMTFNFNGREETLRKRPR